jgi:prepilin peptidase CpaA
MSVVGTFFGAPALIPIALYTFIAGGVLGLAAILMSRSSAQAVRNLRLILFAGAMKSNGAGISLGELDLVPTARVPYALAITAGVLCWLMER